MAIDATFWVAVSFIIFFGALIYLKIPQKITEMLDKMILDIKNEIDESEKLRTDAKTLLDNAQNKLDTAQSVSSEILENIEAAEKQREDSDAKLKEYDEIISKSKLEANSIFNQAREKALKDIGAKREVLDKQIDNEIAEAEKEIDALRKNAPDKINKIAIETSSELLQKLIGAEVNNSSISAIVNDLSKRNGDKYYGN